MGLLNQNDIIEQRLIDYEIYRSKMLHPIIWWIHYRIVLHRREQRRKELHEEFGNNIGKIKKIKFWK